MNRSHRRTRAHGQQYPLAMLAPYGPDNTLATKLVVSVIPAPNREPIVLRKYTTADGDVRNNPIISAEVTDLLRKHGVQQTVTADRLIGCPHEEGLDYPLGRTCPQCPFWANIDRFTHEPIVPAEPTMSVAELLDVLSTDNLERLDEALDSADAHREALTGPLLAALETGIQNPEGASDPETNLFSYALYLLAKWRETRAYPFVLRWLSLPGEGPFDIGGDIVAHDGGRMVASVFDGDLTPIKTLILDRSANEYSRAAGITALSLLAAWGEVPRQLIVDHFCWLAREGLEREPSIAWDVLASCCVDIEAVEALPEIHRAYDAEIINPGFMAREELDAAAAEGRQLEETRDRYPPIDDVAHATAWWHPRAGLLDDDDWAEGDEALGGMQEPYRAPPKVGRNSPCPCGSGKKYKKCCGR